ncbi:Protein of unknown function [Desulfotomaculum arcticum]|uniref:Uncharacterized protein n=1 Tax=Desulfotruncus arcticus DSM 17038 TaxID=1121424 RepID=A0A1I2QL12_9FIRM|nr:DUF2680 domain-containing protein [Desulfotruncus arcticus]SFG28009.1 Protein of unknown function [Desulfotomaculum arcticum] [Desulfotruncus arcticus DSM 17038]
MKSKKWHIGALLLAVVILAGTVTSAFADSTQAKKPDLSNLYQSFIEKFAANLGVSQEQVTTALDQTKQQMLDEAVQQGQITQEQADKIASGEGFNFGPGFIGHKFGAKGDNFFAGDGRSLDNIANVLGMTVDELKTELKDNKMQDVVTAHGLTIEEFQQKMLQIRKDAISQAVTDGKLTQDQADKILQNMENRLNRGPGNTVNEPKDDNN